MIKVIIMILFINFILIFNNKVIFFYNLCYILRFFFIFLYMYKDILWGIIRGRFGIEYYSFWLMVLRVWILGLIYICLKRGEVLKIIVFLSLLIILILFFLSMDLLLFYLFFEVRIIPTFLLIVYWGINPERTRAAFYLILYILIISFPLLIYIFKIYLFSMSIKFYLLEYLISDYQVRFFGYLIIFLAFYIKTPIYIFHVWLPKAHVEAPVYGSIILAGVLLKIGGYGLIRFLIILVKARLKFNYFIFSVRIIGRIMASFVCLIQIDIKRLVAYSSVVHINMLLASIITLFKVGILIAYIIIISHGLCSSGIFFIVNLYYRRTGRRLLLFNKGMIGKLPILSFWWFILCVRNFSYPFSLNFVREVFILGVLLNWERRFVFIYIIICFFRRAYSLYLFSYIQHGDIGYNFEIYYEGKVREFIVLILHIFPLILLLFNLSIFIYLSSLNKTLICGIKNICIYLKLF